MVNETFAKLYHQLIHFKLYLNVDEQNRKNTTEKKDK